MGGFTVDDVGARAFDDVDSRTEDFVGARAAGGSVDSEDGSAPFPATKMNPQCVPTNRSYRKTFEQEPARVALSGQLSFSERSSQLTKIVFLGPKPAELWGLP